MINNRTYQVVYYRGRITGQSGCEVPLTSFVSEKNDVARYCIRNEGKKVYFKGLLSDTTEFLMYDFGLNVGEVVPYLVPSHVITSIDSVLMGSKWHKRFHTGFQGPAGMNEALDIIEGMGCRVGLLPPGSGDNMYRLQKLKCFRETNDVIFYPDNACTCYIYEHGTTGIGETQNVVKITANPNPSDADVLLQLAGENFTSLSILNALGQQVYSEKQHFENELRLNQSIFPVPGAYTVLLSNPERKVFASVLLLRI